MNDLVIVGAGLAGLFSAALAGRRGAQVTLVAEGRGGLEFSHGCIDVRGGAPLRQALRGLRRGHPYALAGRASLEGGLGVFQEVVALEGLPYVGSLGECLRLPTALGSVHATSLAPRSLAAGDLTAPAPLTLAGFDGFRDFYPAQAADNLGRQDIRVGSHLDLPLVDAPTRRDAYASDLARLFDSSQHREQIARAWKPRLKGVQRLGVPAVLGWDHPAEAVRDLEERLGVRLFEIPTLPPSVPGLRLERALRRAALAAGAHLIEGSRAMGRVDGTTAGRRVSGVVAMTAGGPRVIPGKAVLLATGGVLHGGLVARQDGRVQESVFDLPVRCSPDRAEWTAPRFLQSQPYAEFGIQVDAEMRPIGQAREPFFENLFAAGGVLAGADRSLEGSRQGIDLATAYRAVEIALS